MGRHSETTTQYTAATCDWCGKKMDPNTPQQTTQRKVFKDYSNSLTVSVRMAVAYAPIGYDSVVCAECQTDTLKAYIRKLEEFF